MILNQSRKGDIGFLSSAFMTGCINRQKNTVRIINWSTSIFAFFLYKWDGGEKKEKKNAEKNTPFDF